MKKYTYCTIISILLGGFSSWAYSSLIGVVATWGVSQSMQSWIYYLPESFQSIAYLAHCTIQEIVVALIVMGVAGITIGIIVDNQHLRYGFLGFCGALSTYFIIDGAVFTWDDPTLLFWSQFISLGAWLCIFISAALIGKVIRRKAGWK